MHTSLFSTIFLTIFICCGQQSEKVAIQGKNSKILFYADTTPINVKLINIARTHLAKPYLAHTLDSNIVEKLTVRMDGFDCTTLVETVLAQARDSAHMADQITKTRYRNDVLTDYASRIHYFTEWIYENQKQGIVKDITAEFSCSKPFASKINFMTRHRSLYPQLKADSIFNKIKAMENAINTYQWNYIPKQNLASCEKDIKHGDIIAITSNVPGLDIAHLGFAYRKNNQLYLLHASTDEKKVVITSKTLIQYLMAHRKQSGIIIVRVQN